MTLYTYMDDSAALAPSSPVRINGILAGKVKKVALVRRNHSAPGHPCRHGSARRIFSANSRRFHRLHQRRECARGPSSSISRRVRTATRCSPARRFKSLDTREFDEVVQQGYALLASLQGILTRVDKIVGLVETGRAASASCWWMRNCTTACCGDIRCPEAHHAMTTPQGTLGKLLYER